MSKYSSKAQKFIEKKMHKMKEEDKPHAQKVAIVLSMAREKGFKVPKGRKDNPGHGKAGKPDIHCADHEHMARSDRRGANLPIATKKWRP